MQKIRKILQAVPEKAALLTNQPTNQPNIKVSDFGPVWRPFCKYLQIKNFSQKSSSVNFLPVQSPNFMQKIRKILTAISKKTALQTKQATSYYQQHQSYTTSLTPVQKTYISNFQLFLV